MLEFLIDNATLLLTLCALVIGLWLASKFLLRPSAPVEQISGDFTISQLHQYDGQTRPQIFMALKGIIYDVSAGWFYRKGAPYGKFAGHDASVSLAKMSHDEELLDKWGQYTLTAEEEKSLEDWVVKISKKYRKVGVVLQ